MLIPTRSNPEGYESDINGCIFLLISLFRILVFLLKLDTLKEKTTLIFIKKTAFTK